MSGLAIFLLVCLVMAVLAFLLFLQGVFQAFRRQPLVATLFLIFLTPIFFCWVAVEALILSPPDD